MKTIKRYLLDGSTRMIWDDRLGDRERSLGVFPQRASRIEVITSGPHRGRFFVDFSPLAEVTRDTRFRQCLSQTFAGYAEANQAEVRWLLNNWVLAGV